MKVSWENLRLRYLDSNSPKYGEIGYWCDSDEIIGISYFKETGSWDKLPYPLDVRLKVGSVLRENFSQNDIDWTGFDELAKEILAESDEREEIERIYMNSPKIDK